MPSLPVGYHDSLAQGREGNIESYLNLGMIRGVANDAGPLVIQPTGGTYPYPAANVTVEAVSSSVLDAMGVAFIGVAGLNEDYEVVQELVALNGTTPVTLSNQYFRINRTVMLKAPNSTKTNIGTITLRVQSSGDVLSTIPAGRGASRNSVFTAPATHALVVTRYSVQIDRETKSATEGPVSAHLLLRLFSGFPAPGQEAFIGSHWRVGAELSATLGRFGIDIDEPVYLQPKSQFEVRLELLKTGKDETYTIAFYVQGRLERV